MTDQKQCADCSARGESGVDVVQSPMFDVPLCVDCWIERFKDSPRRKE